MQNYNDIKQLALLYFEGKANCEEEAKVFDFIAESAEQKAKAYVRAMGG